MPTESPNRAVETFNRLTPLQKVALGAAVLTLVAGAWVFTQTGQGADMSPLYTDLEPADAAAITDELNGLGIDYELADGGRTVLVPQDDVYDMRIALSAEGLPGSSEGYALLDEQGITTSEFRQRIDYQRALEGELAQTLRAIDGVESATVHLALPEESVFIDEPTEPTASVLIRSSGPAITGEQVAAMIHLVASSVKGMAPEGVTIADSTGAILSTGGETGATAGDARADTTSAYERELAAELQGMVARVTGFDSVSVNVQASLDLTEKQSTSEVFDSSDEESGVVVNERVASETYSGSQEPGDTGVLGPDGATVSETVDGNESAYSKDDTQRNYAVNRTVTSTVEAPGDVERLHVAVLVDEGSVTEVQAAEIEAMVATAAGIDTQRGDQISVTRLTFDRGAREAVEEATTALEDAAATRARNTLIQTIVIGAIVLIAVLLAYRSVRRARREIATPIDIGEIRAARLDDDEDEDEVAALAPPPEPEPEPDPVALASQNALEELSALADRSPEDVAQILQSWLADEAVKP